MSDELYQTYSKYAPVDHSPSSFQKRVFAVIIFISLLASTIVGLMIVYHQSAVEVRDIQLQRQTEEIAGNCQIILGQHQLPRPYCYEPSIEKYWVP